MTAPHNVWYSPPKLMKYQGRWRCRINWFLPVASSTLEF